MEDEFKRYNEAFNKYDKNPTEQNLNEVKRLELLLKGATAKRFRQSNRRIKQIKEGKSDRFAVEIGENFVVINPKNNEETFRDFLSSFCYGVKQDKELGFIVHSEAIIAYDKFLNEQLWGYGHRPGVPNIGITDQLVLAGRKESQTIALEKQLGKLLWTNDLKNFKYSAEDEDNLFISSKNELRSVDKYTGKTIWENYHKKSHGIALTKNNIYVLTSDKVVAFDKNNGNKLWTRGGSFYGITADEDNIYLGSRYNGLTKVNEISNLIYKQPQLNLTEFLDIQHNKLIVGSLDDMFPVSQSEIDEWKRPNGMIYIANKETGNIEFQSNMKNVPFEAYFDKTNLVVAHADRSKKFQKGYSPKSNGTVLFKPEIVLENNLV